MPSFARLLGIGCWTAVAGHRLRTHPYQQLLPEASQPATRPATNLIRRRKVLRYGEQSGVPGPDLLTRSCFPMLPQRLPPGHSVQSPSRSGNFSAQTSASLHPSRSASLAGPSHSRGEGTEKVSEHSVITQRTIYNYLVVCWIFCIFK